MRWIIISIIVIVIIMFVFNLSPSQVIDQVKIRIGKEINNPKELGRKAQRKVKGAQEWLGDIKEGITEEQERSN